MFKVLILQRYYKLSDEQLEYQINDRMRFMRFLDLTIADAMPDSRRIWLFSERLTHPGLVKELFGLLESSPEGPGLIAREGKLADASFVEVPRQRNSRQENARIKGGTVAQEWTEQPAKLRRKDTDARWTGKNNQNYYGYKHHAKADAKSKLITDYLVPPASTHDSQALNELPDASDKGRPLYAASACTGQQKILEKYEVEDQICEKGTRNRPLNQTQQQSDKEKSKTSVRLEHGFGFMENGMGTMFNRKTGKGRAETVIGLMNLTCNRFRKLQLEVA